MSAFFSTMATAFDATTAFVGREFVYNGTTYVGVLNFLSTSEIIDYGGFQSHLSATIAVSCAIMPTAPNKGERITINGIDRRVVNVTNNNGVSWHISLEDVSR
jgi:hypothetical protein